MPRDISDEQGMREVHEVVRQNLGIGEWGIAQRLRISVERAHSLARKLENSGYIRRLPRAPTDA